jgi:GNAT superfamily N-acetyltransferase
MSLHATKPISVGYLFPKRTRLDHDAGVELDICLLTAAEARRVANGRRDKAVDRPWAKGYPLDGDKRACMAYIGQLAVTPGTRGSGGQRGGSGDGAESGGATGLRPIVPWPRRAGGTRAESQDGAAVSSPFGYYQIVLDDTAVGGIGFHGPPRDGVVEVGYAVVPRARRQGVASRALHLLLDMAAALPGVRVVCGRTTADNVASQRVMLGAGMRLVGRDPDFLHFEIELVAEPGRPGRPEAAAAGEGQGAEGHGASGDGGAGDGAPAPRAQSQAHPARWSR